MNVKDKVIVITGGASGIGKALAERFHHEGAKSIAVADLDGAGAEEVARSVGGLAFTIDVSKEEDVVRLITETEAKLGPIDLYCSNAGVSAGDRDPRNVASATNDTWHRVFDINVMAHVYAARALVPKMTERGGGYFLITASAAGLLSQIGSAVYSTTKHAAVGFAEILAITHKDDGIKVSLLCPQAVATNFGRTNVRFAGGSTEERGERAGRVGSSTAAVDGVLSADAVADSVLKALEEERFLILPHESVAQYMQNKVSNYDRWIGGMAKLRRTTMRSQS
jgi:NAD(P)-dependent dehydrogenase (short-subunit alcohol dehydrogenase family)